MVREPVSPAEISNKINGIMISAEDSRTDDRSLYGQYKDLYDTALMWCELVLRAEGWRTQGKGHHESAISGFREFLGEEVEVIAVFLDRCRRPRSIVRYDFDPLIISPIELEELRETVDELEQIVLTWLKNKHPELIQNE